MAYRYSDLPTLENYFAKLRDYLVILVQLREICDNTDDLLGYLNTENNNIEERLSYYTVPHYTDFKFPDIKTDGIYNVKIKEYNNTCRGMLDTLIDELADKIHDLSIDIDQAKKNYPLPEPGPAPGTRPRG